MPRSRSPPTTTALTADLDYLLDLDAGLHDIQRSPVRPTPPTLDQASVTGPLLDFVHRIATRPAHERLTTRIWFPQPELLALQTIATAINDFRSLALISELKRAHIRALEFASELERAIEGPLGSTRWLSIVVILGDAHRHALDFALALVDKRDSPLVLTRKLERDLARVRDNIVAHARNRLPTTHNNDLVSTLADILTGADLTYANLDGVPLDGVRWSSDTRWPPRFQKILTNLAQFDILGCLVVLAEVGNERAGGVFYPSFARFYATRTQPITQRLLREPEMCRILYPHEDDSHLARSLQLIDKMARQEGFRFDGWDGYSGDVVTFIQTHISVRE